MQKYLPVLVIAIVLVSCSAGGAKKDELPARPASIKTVQDGLKGNYAVSRVGTHSVFSNDSSIQWLEPKKEQEFESKFVDELKTLHLNFVNDTSVTVNFNNKSTSGTYKVDALVNDEEKPGIKLRISYVDEEFKFGDGPASLVTYTYLVEGMNDKTLVLETPRSINNRKAVVLMTK